MKSCFMDRDLSWLEFNDRILEEADDTSVPLLERLKFINIFQSNLDEFLMVRVGSLTHRCILLPDYIDPKTGWKPDMRLKKILKEAGLQQQKAADVYERLKADLHINNIEVVDFDNISKLDSSIAKKLYAEVKEFLSPRIVDGKRPMQFLGNRELYVASYLQKGSSHCLGIVSLFRVPPFRIFESNGAKKVFIMSELVAHYSKNLYKKYTCKESCVIKTVRNADVFISDSSDDYDGDFREEMESLLKKRKRQQPVFLMVDGTPSKLFKQALIKELGLEDRRVFISRKALDLNFGSELGSMSQLKYVPRKSVRGTELKRGQLIKSLKEKDLLLAYPFHSMDAFVDLIYEAGDNPNVKSIKITLYRLSYSSKIAMALAYAADKGKDVLALLELRARFDEKNNIDYSEMLTAAGCRVIYGLPDMKVHAKLCLITLRNGRKLSHITQVGTGNYNENTAAQYCDLSLITSDERPAADALKVFEALELGEAPERTEFLMTAPNSFKQRLIEILEEECAKGSKGQVSIKINSMNDMDVMQELIKCSCAGVKIDLYIRGICCLVPGIKGQTENISVKSIVGRYLEHSRIIVVGKGTKRRIFMGSGDLLSRNTSRRVEVLTEVCSEDAKRRILYIMKALAADQENSWNMLPDGSYHKCEIVKGTSSQDRLFKYFAK